MPITVLCAEDSESWRHLRDHASFGETHGDAEPVVMWDPQTPEVRTAGRLLDVLREAYEDPETEPPDVVLIDDWMTWDANAPLRPSAVRLAGEITRSHGRDRPKLVLWTSRQEEPWPTRFAFLSYGGHHVAPKNHPGDEYAHTVEIIRAVYAGRVARFASHVDHRRRPWRPAASNTEGDGDFVARNLDLLAALEYASTREEAAQVAGVSEAALGRAQTRLAVALGRDRLAEGQNWTAAQVCAAAREQGWVWVSPGDWEHCPFAVWRRAGAMKMRRQSEN